MSPGCVLAAVALALRVAAQAPPPLLQRVAWPLMDFVVLGDSTHGVQLVTSPNLRSKQGRAGTGGKTLTLEPVAASRWARGVAVLIDSVSRMRRDDRTPFETVPLVANRGQSRLVVLMQRDAPRARPFVFTLIDTSKAASWAAEASRDELRSLLVALDAIAEVSALDTVRRAGRTYATSDLDRRPETPPQLDLVYPVRAQRHREEGRVLAKFVIDTTGAVPLDSLRILLSDGEPFTREVQRALSRATYVPGRRGGRPVNTVVWQWFVFRLRDGPSQ